MSAPPYMKLYIADYLGDTHHLSVVEHGAYLLLLMAMWRAGGSLPAIDANLAKLARCTPDQWAEIRDVVLGLFKRSRGRLTQKRLAAEMAKYENISGKRSEAGKRGGRQKPRENNDPDEANAVGKKSNCRHNQNHNQKEEEPPSPPSKARRKPETPLSEGFPDAELITAEQAKVRAAGYDVDANLEAEKFRNHAAQTDRRCRDWPAAFRNWMLKTHGWAPKLTRSPGRPSGVADPWRRRVLAWTKNRYWDTDAWGPKPGRPGCLCPPELLADEPAVLPFAKAAAE